MSPDILWHLGSLWLGCAKHPVEKAINAMSNDCNMLLFMIKFSRLDQHFTQYNMPWLKRLKSENYNMICMLKLLFYRPTYDRVGLNLTVKDLFST